MQSVYAYIYAIRCCGALGGLKSCRSGRGCYIPKVNLGSNLNRCQMFFNYIYSNKRISRFFPINSNGNNKHTDNGVLYSHISNKKYTYIIPYLQYYSFFNVFSLW